MFEIKVAASDEERRKIYEFRYNYYFETMKRADVRGLDQNNRLQLEEIDHYSELYYILKDQILVGVLRQSRLAKVPYKIIEADGLDMIYDLDKFLRFTTEDKISMNSRLILDPKVRGSFALGTLFSQAYTDGLNAGIEFDFLTAAPNVVEVYGKSGYRRYKAGIEHPENGYDVPMVLALNDVSYLTKISSPLLRPRKKIKNLAWERSVSDKFLKEFSTALKTHHENVISVSNVQLSIELYKEHALSTLNIEELTEILKFATMIKLNPGEKIIRSNQRRDEMYIVLNGCLDVTFNAASSAEYKIYPGGIVGEMAMFGQNPRSADITANSRSLLLLFSRDSVLRMMRKNSDLSSKLLFNVAKSLSKKLLAANEKGKLND